MEFVVKTMGRLRRPLQLVVFAFIALMLWTLVATRFEPADTPTVEQLLPAEALDEARALRERFGGTIEGVLIQLPPQLDETAWQALLSRLTELEGILPPVCIPHTVNSQVSTSAKASGLLPVICTDAQQPPGYLALRRMNDENHPPLSEAVESIVAEVSASALAEPVRIYGQDIIRAESWRTARSDLSRIAPLLALIVIVLPLAVFRSLSAPTFLLVAAALTTTLTVLISDWILVGGFNSLLLVVVPVIWAVATMDAMHLVDRVQVHRARANSHPVRQTIRELTGPCGITTLTTAIGFGALALQDDSPLLRSFGIAAAIGTVLAIVITFALARLFLNNGETPTTGKYRPDRLAGVSHALVVFSSRYPEAITAAWLILVLAATPLALSLSVNSPFPGIFSADHPLSKITLDLQDGLGTDLRPLTLYLVPEGASGKDPERLYHAVAATAHYLDTLNETRLVLPTLSGESRETLKVDPQRLDEITRGWYDEASGSARLEIHFTSTSLSRHKEIMEWLAGFDRNMLGHHRLVPDGAGYQYPLAERLGVDGAVNGMVWSVLGVLLCLIITFRQFRRILPALLVTALPLWLMTGLMGLLDIQWSLALLAVPAVLFGLAVDDSVHLLWQHRRGASLTMTLRRNALIAGPALTTTTLMLMLCVALMGFSGLQANRDIALLLPAGMAIALAADLSLLPAVVSLMRRRSPRSRR